RGRPGQRGVQPTVRPALSLVSSARVGQCGLNDAAGWAGRPPAQVFPPASPAPSGPPVPTKVVEVANRVHSYRIRHAYHVRLPRLGPDLLRRRLPGLGALPPAPA